jgi:hypothetical protein
MGNLDLTKHAQTRIQQRGFKTGDVDLIIELGTPIAGDAFLLTDEDVAREIAARHEEIRRLKRLRGTKAVLNEGDCVVTAYRACTRTQKRNLRRKLRHNH